MYWSDTRPALALTLIVAAGFASGTARASGDAVDGLVGLGAEADSDGNTRLLAGVDWHVAAATWVQATAGWTDSPQDRGAVTTRSLDLGLEQRLGDFGFTLSGGYWGEPDELETWGYHASAFVTGGAWRAGVGFGRRDIEIVFRLPQVGGGVLERSSRLHDQQLSLDLRYSGERWASYLSVTDYRYSRDLARLGELPRLRLLALSRLSASALTLANSFLDDSLLVGVERRAGLHAFNLEYGRDEIIIDGTQADTFSGGWLMPVGGRSDLELRIGYSDAGTLGDSVFIGLLLLFYAG